MTRKRIALALSAALLVSTGVLAGSVIGSDGTVPIVDRMPTSLPDPEVIAVDAGRSASASGSGKAQIIADSTGARPIAAGAIDYVELKCPKKTVAISGGYATSDAGIVPFYLGRISKQKYAAAAYNLSTTDLQWEADVTCEKGVKWG